MRSAQSQPNAENSNPLLKNKRLATRALRRWWETQIHIRAALWALVGLLLLLSVAGCRGTSGAVAADQEAATQAPGPASTANRPPLVAASTPTDLPSFAPVPADELAADVAATDRAATVAADAMAAEATQIPSSTATLDSSVGPTATAAPTFTPPASPNASPNEHYWFRRPVAQGGIVWTDKYYPYGSTRGGQLRAHHGVEFNVPYNTEILAAASGTVRVAGPDSETAYGPHTNFYGNLVVIEHEFQFAGKSVFTVYGHLNEVLVAVGEHVAAQDVIGLSGATGVADGPHMHFEVRVGTNDYGNTRNPLLWLYPFPDRGTIAGRLIWPSGEPVAEAPISLNRIDGDAPYYGTTTYAQESVNSDEGWQENFAIDDVVAGYYEVVVRIGDKKVKAETWVYPFQTSFVEIVLN